MDSKMTQVIQYADTAYTGKANPYFRENIAPPEQRSR
jgi:methyl coenzyme M reductase gamma subunit